MFGLLRTGLEERLFNCVKAISQSHIHKTWLGVFFLVRSIIGLAIPAMKFRINFGNSPWVRKRSYLLFSLRSRTTLHCFQLRWLRMKLSIPHNVTQIRTLGCCELTLSWVSRASCKQRKTNPRCSRCSYHDPLYMIKSSRSTKVNFFLWIMSFIRLWNIARAPIRPKGISVNSYRPEVVTNAILALSFTATGTWQYPLVKSKAVMYLQLQVLQWCHPLLAMDKPWSASHCSDVCSR